MLLDKTAVLFYMTSCNNIKREFDNEKLQDSKSGFTNKIKVKLQVAMQTIFFCLAKYNLKCKKSCSNCNL